jgi:hypothetical protein
MLRRFERERRALGSLSGHDGIVTVYQSGTTDQGDPYLLMPSYEQGSLEDAIAESGPRPWREASAWMAQVARTLADACAAADYRYVSTDGSSAGSHSSAGYPSPATCSTDHQALLGAPGWTPAPLDPHTSYTVTVTVIAQGGATATTTLTFATP